MEQVDPSWYAIFHCWCWQSGGSRATGQSKLTYCWSVLASILTSFYFLGHICAVITCHSGLWFFFQMWLGSVTGSPSENVVMFPAYPPRFYGGVRIKTLGKNRHPNLLCHILRLLWLSSLPRRFHCQMWDLVHCFPYIYSFSCTCVGACQIPGSVILRIFTTSRLFVVLSLLSWSPFSPNTLVLHLHGCPLIPSS